MSAFKPSNAKGAQGKFYNLAGQMADGLYFTSKTLTPDECQAKCYGDYDCRAWEHCAPGGNCDGCYLNKKLTITPHSGAGSDHYAELVRPKAGPLPTGQTPTSTCGDKETCTTCEGNDVYYGYKDQYVKMTDAPASFECTDTVFGDPIGGFKECKCYPTPEQAKAKAKAEAVAAAKAKAEAIAKEAAEKVKEAEEAAARAAREATARAKAMAAAKAREAEEAKARAAAAARAHQELLALDFADKNAEDQLATLDKEATQATTQIRSLTDQINKIQLASKSLQSDVSIRSSDIQAAQAQLTKQKTLLEEGRRLLITRNRMLQLSQDRNIYKQKVIFTLLALIIVCFVLILVGYVSFKKLSA